MELPVFLESTYLQRATILLVTGTPATDLCPAQKWCQVHSPPFSPYLPSCTKSASKALCLTIDWPGFQLPPTTLCPCAQAPLPLCRRAVWAVGTSPLDIKIGDLQGFLPILPHSGHISQLLCSRPPETESATSTPSRLTETCFLGWHSVSSL